MKPLNAKNLVFFILFYAILILVPNILHATIYSWTTLAEFHGIDQFNLFLKGDIEYYRSDVEGRVAVGGNAKLKAFSIGLKADHNDYNLIVGGKINAGGPGNSEGGQVNNGGIFAGGNIDLQRIGLPEGDIVSKGDVSLKELTVEKGGVRAAGKVDLKNVDVKKDVEASGSVTLTNSTVHGTVHSNSSPSISDPFNFDEVDLASISTDVKNYSGASNGIVSAGGTLLLDCDDISICYFNLTKAEIENAGLFKINAKSNATVVINVDGSSNSTLEIANKGFELSGGIRSTNILYNLYKFNEITMHNIGIPGSILAPGATIDFFEGNMEGILMAKNLIGGSLGNNIRGGQINTPTPVPEPSTTILVVTGCIILFLLFFRKKYLPQEIK